MKSLQEKEQLFNRFHEGKMEKRELTELVKHLLTDKQLREWFIVQMEYVSLCRISRFPS